MKHSPLVCPSTTTRSKQKEQKRVPQDATCPPSASTSKRRMYHAYQVCNMARCSSFENSNVDTKASHVTHTPKITAVSYTRGHSRSDYNKLHHLVALRNISLQTQVSPVQTLFGTTKIGIASIPCNRQRVRKEKLHGINRRREKNKIWPPTIGDELILSPGFR